MGLLHVWNCFYLFKDNSIAPDECITTLHKFTAWKGPLFTKESWSQRMGDFEIEIAFRVVHIQHNIYFYCILVQLSSTALRMSWEGLKHDFVVNVINTISVPVNFLHNTNNKISWEFSIFCITNSFKCHVFFYSWHH